MKVFWLVILSLTGFAFENADLEAIRVKSDLEEIFKKLTPADTFVVQVVGDYHNVSEKKLIESQISQQKSATEPKIEIPELPGFESESSVAQSPATPAEQSKETYRISEKEALKLILVQLILDNTLPIETVQQLKDVANNYLKINFGKNYALHVNSIKMLPPEKPVKLHWWELPWVWSLASVFVAFILLAALILARTRKPHDRVLPQGISKELEKSDFSKDARRFLLALFSSHPEAFSAYFSRLPTVSQELLSGQLAGPAFSSFAEGLGLKLPANVPNSDTDIEQIKFFEKDFSEFVNIFAWQKQQFFGFLKQASLTQLQALADREDPMVAAVLLQFMVPEQSSQVLGQLPAERRVLLMQQFENVSKLTPDQIAQIEKHARAEIERLHQSNSNFKYENVQFWADVLDQADNPEPILEDIEKSLPKIYSQLSKYRFKVEDILGLPVEKTSAVLGRIENDELAKALLGCTPELQQVMLEAIPANRREFVSSQMSTLTDLPVEKIIEAKRHLIQQFRKVVSV